MRTPLPNTTSSNFASLLAIGDAACPAPTASPKTPRPFRCARVANCPASRVRSMETPLCAVRVSLARPAWKYWSAQFARKGRFRMSSLVFLLSYGKRPCAVATHAVRALGAMCSMRMQKRCNGIRHYAARAMLLASSSSAKSVHAVCRDHLSAFSAPS